VCRALGAQPAAVALAWLRHTPVVTAPITGPRTLGRLDSYLHVLDVTLSDETLDRLEEIFPGPGKGHGLPAPDADAW